ncbi:MAG: hypothetical protein WBM08_14535 [Prochlorococcaceae cyanobacterium]
MTTRYDWKPPVRSLIRHLNAHNIEPISVDDGEETVQLTKANFFPRREEATEIITSVDESRLNVMCAGQAGWLLIILGNEPEELVADYSPGSRRNDLGARLAQATTAYSKQWEGKPCPRIQIEDNANA